MGPGLQLQCIWSIPVIENDACKSRLSTVVLSETTTIPTEHLVKPKINYNRKTISTRNKDQLIPYSLFSHFENLLENAE